MWRAGGGGGGVWRGSGATTTPPSLAVLEWRSGETGLAGGVEPILFIPVYIYILIYIYNLCLQKSISI